MLTYHMISFCIGFLLDQIFGDPHWLFHPIRLIGMEIKWLESRFYKRKDPMDAKDEYKRGCILVITVLLTILFVTLALLVGGYWLHPFVGMFFEAIGTYYILAAKCLKDESMKVYKALQTGTLQEARQAVSMIVGRDTNVLDEKGIMKATVETIAENASDGVIAPLIYTAIGGPVVGFLYKGINTMDSMIGYRNDRYLYFGRAGAKLDDIVNYVPARLSAYLMIASAACLGKEYCQKDAYRIYKRDRRNHASPNSAQTEAACAGALGIRLAGDATYFGKIVKKPFIGDPKREIEIEDISRSNRLMYTMTYLCMIACLGMMCVGQLL